MRKPIVVYIGIQEVSYISRHAKYIWRIHRGPTRLYNVHRTVYSVQCATYTIRYRTVTIVQLPLEYSSGIKERFRWGLVKIIHSDV